MYDIAYKHDHNIFLWNEVGMENRNSRDDSLPVDICQVVFDDIKHAGMSDSMIAVLAKIMSNFCAL